MCRPYICTYLYTKCMYTHVYKHVCKLEICWVSRSVDCHWYFLDRLSTNSPRQRGALVLSGAWQRPLVESAALASSADWGFQGRSSGTPKKVYVECLGPLGT